MPSYRSSHRNLLLLAYPARSHVRACMNETQGLSFHGTVYDRAGAATNSGIPTSLSLMQGVRRGCEVHVVQASSDIARSIAAHLQEGSDESAFALIQRRNSGLRTTRPNLSNTENENQRRGRCFTPCPKILDLQGHRIGLALTMSEANVLGQMTPPSALLA